VFISLPASKTVQSFSAGSTGLTPSTASFGAVALAGTLVPANGGTGTSTAFTAGSVVFAGASGVYAQDNASLFFDDTNNRLGIGTVSPDALLTVNTIASFGAGAAALPSIAAKGDLDTGMWFPAADTIAASTGGSERLRITSTGNVGIGTSSPTARLQAYGTSGTAQARLGTANGYVEVTAFDASPVYCVVNGASHTAGVFGTQSNTPTILFTNNTEKLRIDTSGNVGIGTSSPDTLLTVSGSSKFGGTMTTGLGVSTGDAHIELGGARTGNGNSYIDFHSAASTDFEARLIRGSGTNGQFDIINAGTGAFTLSQNTTERLRLDNSGNLLFNSGYGSVATAYGCRAWVNFNGTGTVAIRGSGNVSSITDNGTGDYSINFATAMPDANYAYSHAYSNEVNVEHTVGFLSSISAAAIRVQHYNPENSGNTADKSFVLIGVFR
jgi:hypothetical protein